ERSPADILYASTHPVSRGQASSIPADKLKLVMFENLSDKLQRSFKTLRGEGTITDENISEALREIRLALIEADVSLPVVTQVVDHIRERALGSQFATAFSPAEQIVKIVHDELINILGRDTARFKTSSQPPSVIL